MVNNRVSIASAARQLADLVFEGGTILPEHKRLAAKVLSLVKSSGIYVKQYATHEERVLMRHLNLFKNKLEAAKTDDEKYRWRTKLLEQEAKVRAFHSRNGDSDNDLDLDGL